MFERINLLDATDVGLENIKLADQPGSVPTAEQTPAPPPMRFGAIRIPMEEDGWDSKIRIKEFPNINNANDYIVILNGEIPSDNRYFAELVTLLETLTEASTVIIRICSPGGSLGSGSVISSAIIKCKAKVITVACGVVASAAALIWSYGHERRVEDQAVILFHMSSHMSWGNSELIRITADNLVRYVKEVAIDPMVAQGLLTHDESEAIIDKRQDVLIPASIMKVRLENVHV